jgi:hypothetical protein
VIPNSARNPLLLIQETEAWLLAEATQTEAVLGDIPLVRSLRGRASYLRNVREALTRAATVAA